MTKSEALAIADNCIFCIESGQNNKVWDKLLPVLNERTPFRALV